MPCALAPVRGCSGRRRLLNSSAVTVYGDLPVGQEDCRQRLTPRPSDRTINAYHCTCRKAQDAPIGQRDPPLTREGAFHIVVHVNILPAERVTFWDQPFDEEYEITQSFRLQHCQRCHQPL